MKVVILAGGMGTRINEESHSRPKPMIEIGERPILWHIMKIYSSFGYNDFVICLGHKGVFIKEYFEHYFLHESDVTFEFDGLNKSCFYHQTNVEPWRVTLCDTGLNTMTGGRIKRIKKYIGNEPFMLTYGDGVSDVDIDKLLEFHNSHGKMVTVTSVRPTGRYGALEIDDTQHVRGFIEKPKGGEGWISGGFFVCQPEIFDYIDGDATVFEREPLERASRESRLMAYQHSGFWGCMDSMRDKDTLEELWNNGNAPWKRF